MDGEAGMTRDTLEALIGRMLDAETRDTPPPAGEEGDPPYSSRAAPRLSSPGMVSTFTTEREPRRKRKRVREETDRSGSC